MSQIIQTLVSVMIGAIFCAVAFAQDCKNSAATAWNESVRYVTPGCAAEFPSPDHQLLLKFTTDGTMSIKRLKIRLSEGLRVPTIMVSWSPKSDAFFVNDGEGSGMTSTFRLFRITSSTVFEDKAVEKATVALYRRRTHCSGRTLDPDVWGFGWDD